MGKKQEQGRANQEISQKDPLKNRGGAENRPRFKSVAAMAVEDTPERGSKEKKRPELHSSTPPTNSRRKRRCQRRSPISNQSTSLDLDDEEVPTNNDSTPVMILDLDKQEDGVNKTDDKKKKDAGNELKKDKNNDSVVLVENSSALTSALPDIDKLRDELSCAICLELCFEPSTTPCGHCFCKKCLTSAADQCGKRCPKCRELNSNERSYTVNTVLWNTIQLLFPAEVEARKAAGALNTRELECQNTENCSRSDQNTATNNNVQSSSSGEDGNTTRSNQRATPLQDEDAALALRLQREESMPSYNRPPPVNGEYRRGSVSEARWARVVAMERRAISVRNRNSSLSGPQQRQI